MTTYEVAALLGVTSRAVIKMIAAGHLHSRRIGQIHIITAKEARQLLRSRQKAAKASK